MTGSQFDNNPQRALANQQSPAASPDAATEQVHLTEASFSGRINADLTNIVPVEQGMSASSDVHHSNSSIPLESILESFPVGTQAESSLEPLPNGRVSSETVKALSPLAIAVQSLERAPSWTEGVEEVEHYLGSLSDNELGRIIGEIRGSRTTLGLVGALLRGGHNFSAQELTVNSLAQLEQANRQA